MRRRGLHTHQPKAFTPRTTDSTHGLRCASNRLFHQPKTTQANPLWVSNIICLPLANGDWACLCAFQDMVSQQVVGWQVGAAMPEELITTALQRAFWALPPTPGLLVHAGQGNCYDNAQAESLWSRLKKEVLEGRERPVFIDLADAQASVADHFGYYNHERLHSSIDY